MNIYKFSLVASVLAVSQLFWGANAASAQIEQVPFSGVVVASCAFNSSAMVPGSLTLTNGGRGLTSSALVTIPISCNSNARIAVTGVNQNRGFNLSTLPGYSAVGTASSSSGTANSTGATYTITVGANGSFAQTIATGLTITTNSVIPADTYGFDVVVSATPI